MFYLQKGIFVTLLTGATLFGSCPNISFFANVTAPIYLLQYHPPFHRYADLQPLRACVMYNTEARTSVWTRGYHTVCPTDSLFDFCGQRSKRTCTFGSAKRSVDVC